MESLIFGSLIALIVFGIVLVVLIVVPFILIFFVIRNWRHYRSGTSNIVPFVITSALLFVNIYLLARLYIDHHQ